MQACGRIVDGGHDDKCDDDNDNGSDDDMCSSNVYDSDVV